MSTATIDYDSTVDGDESLHYRALHTGALIGLVLGISSVFIVITAADTPEWCPVMVPIPVLGIFVSARSLARIKREPDAYTGSSIAIIGLVLSVTFLASGVAYGSYVYATEVPDGYARISFNGMKPDEIQERGGIPVRPEIDALNGKKVFIKGYIRKDSVKFSSGIDEFLLVRDNNQCCFGDLSSVKFYDRILVNMKGDLRVTYTDSVIRIGGILKVVPENLSRGPLNPVYSLEADYVN